MSLTDLTATELIAQLASGEVTSAEVTQHCLDHIHAHNEQIGAFLSVDDDGARRADGQPLGPLAGLPVAVKDNLCTRGQTTTCASRMLDNFKPPYDATVVKRLRSAGAVLVGKTNLDEFAMGGSTENSALAVTRNPWNQTCVPGGSSGGSAACVAASITNSLASMIIIQPSP